MLTFKVPEMKRQHKICIPLPEYRVVFILTPKVASTSIILTLIEHYEAAVKRPFHGNSVFSWMTLDQVNEFVPDYERIMFVRNPFERLVATYEYQIVNQNLQSSRNLRDLGFTAGMTFREYVEIVLKNTEADPHYAIQCWQTDVVHFIGRFENLQKDWERMKSDYKMSFPSLAHKNKNKKSANDYRFYYDDDLKERVKRAYAHDMKAFGYGF